MLYELEEKVLKILRKEVKEVAEENIRIGFKIDIKPSILLKNVAFKIDKSNIVEEEGELVTEEFDGDGERKDYVLKETPSNIVSVEHPAGKRLEELQDYNVDYERKTILFRVQPSKGNKNIIIRYNTKTKKVEVNRLKIEAKYHIIITSKDRQQLDNLIENVIKILYQSEKSFEEIGTTFKPLYGKMVEENQAIISCNAETELKITRIVPPIERIEIREQRKV
ncbi:MAG: hypothetical protein N3F64_02725 [Nitrososphaeria archaeon]|nr:hypothetical protein [Nitrososphaeria archaeon]